MGAPKGILITPVGLDPDGTLRMLELDANDNLKVALADPAAAFVGSHGWFAAGWSKNPLNFGFSDTAGGNLSNANLAGGSENLNGSAVAAGQLEIITAVAIRYDGTSPTRILAMGDLNNIEMPLLDQASPTSGRWYTLSGWWVMQEGDFMYGRVEGATATDDLFFKYVGYTMDLLE